MKKEICMLLMVLLPSLAFSTNRFGKYGFNGSSIEKFKQYLGKTVMYLPCSPINDEEKFDNMEKFTPEAEYVITEIKEYDDIFHMNEPKVTFKEKGGKKTIKCDIRLIFAEHLPFLLIDDFNMDKPSIIGRSFKDPQVKGEYIVNDIRLERVPNSPRVKNIQYYVSNSEINRDFVSSDLEGTIQRYLNEDKSGRYNATLVKVEKPENSSDRYGEVKTVEDVGITKYSFEDDYINIIISEGNTQFDFKLSNKSQNSIKIIWDEAVYADYSGATSKIIHSGIKYIQREGPQPASTIIKGASLEEIACPMTKIRYDDFWKKWVTDSMYPKEGTKETLQNRLMLPIQIKDVVNEYTFIFDVKYTYNHPERIN